jgi:DNA-binding transcriptional LysR family regulator
MIIDGIKLQDLRIFQSVYEHKSMTGAAKELFMTQSGISQHVKILEDELSVVLFDRIQQRLVPTSDAHLLYQKIKTTLNLLEQSLSEVRGDLKNQPTHLMGEVSIGIPPEFGINLVVPKLMPLMKEFPKIKVNFVIGFASDMNDALLKGDLDFAYIDPFLMDQKIVTQLVYEEPMELCCSEEYYLNHVKGHPQDKSLFESLDYVEYQLHDGLIHRWFESQTGVKNYRLQVRSTILNVQGVAQIIQNGLAVGLLPGHYIDQLNAQNIKFYLFKEIEGQKKGKHHPLINKISLAYLKDRTQSSAAQACLKALEKF